MPFKKIIFVGAALAELKSFPVLARKEAGSQLFRVQLGNDPEDWKPMTTIGPGVREIRIRDSKGAFRIIYLAQRKNFVFVLHCFQKENTENGTSKFGLGDPPIKGN